jgi:hypothetical protein
MQTRDLVRVSLFAALIGALGLAPRFDLPIAAGVPVTAQTLGVMRASSLERALARHLLRSFSSSSPAALRYCRADAAVLASSQVPRRDI